MFTWAVKEFAKEFKCYVLKLLHMLKNSCKPRVMENLVYSAPSVNNSAISFGRKVWYALIIVKDAEKFK